jgi:hypothetical protein
MAETTFRIDVGPMMGTALGGEAEKGIYQVTVINQSNHNCTGGIISLRSTSGEIPPPWQLPYIPIGQSASHVFIDSCAGNGIRRSQPSV